MSYVLNSYLLTYLLTNFTKRLTAYMAVATNCGHFEHLQ